MSLYWHIVGGPLRVSNRGFWRCVSVCESSGCWSIDSPMGMYRCVVEDPLGVSGCFQ